MVHAIEAYTSNVKKNFYADMLAQNALKLLNHNLAKVLKNGADLEARQNMLVGSMLAGQAFANAPVGAVHALAYPLDGLPSAQWEIMVLVTEDGHEVLCW
jgi:alcohol dehydrogenase